MDKIRPQDDLYEYVNGEWLKTAIIPDDRPMVGGFSQLDMEVEELMMKEMSAFEKGEKSSDILGVADAIRLYRLVKDINKRNELDAEPVLPILSIVDSLGCVNCLNKNAYQLAMKGVDLPFNFMVDTDMGDARSNSFIIMGPTTILPDTAYYGTENGEALLKVYAENARKALGHTKLSAEDIDAFVEDTLAFDALVAKKVKSAVEWADYVNNHNPMSVDEVSEYLKPFDFRKFLSDIYGDKLPTTVDVYDPKAIKEFNDYYSKENFKLYKHWAYVKKLLAASKYLSEELHSISTAYRRAITGVTKDPVIEKEAYQVTSSVFAEPIGVYYGRTYFGEEAKADVVSLVKKIIATYQRRVAENKFLAEETKKKAILKLSTINIKMGYPDGVRDIYKQLTVDENDSYYDAMTKLNEVLLKENLGKLHKKVDRNEWLMPGHMVNACYDPQRNDITFPAGILQKPFYSIKQTVSENLGGIGAVIAHEVSHAFDNNGAHFDENGNIFNWWTEEDFKAFDEKTKAMIEQWDGIKFCNDVVNGELVVSENIADNGGLAVALDIMHQIKGTDFKLFFENWAKVWCSKAKEEFTLYLLKNDVHSPSKLRCNIAIRNFDEWYETFDVKEGDGLYLPKEERIIVW
ncbi:MAG: M13 family metallopeptidase [Erysipelotrichaceae bacterium]|nr:M13 family metallopeptidase [Erysipelotrichaceae bacterium]